MGFRYDMKDKSPAAQALVRNREREEEVLKQNEKKRKRADFECKPSPRNGDYEGVIFSKDGQIILELRVSGPARMNSPCGLKNMDIHNWLCKTGRTFIDEVKKFEILEINSNDVRDKELVTGWTNLKRSDQ